MPNDRTALEKAKAALRWVAEQGDCTAPEEMKWHAKDALRDIEAEEAAPAVAGDDGDYNWTPTPDAIAGSKMLDELRAQKAAAPAPREVTAEEISQFKHLCKRTIR